MIEYVHPKIVAKLSRLNAEIDHLKTMSPHYALVRRLVDSTFPNKTDWQRNVDVSSVSDRITVYLHACTSFTDATPLLKALSSHGYRISVPMTKSDSTGTFEWRMQKDIGRGFTTDVEIVLFITAEEVKSDSKYTCTRKEKPVATE